MGKSRDARTPSSATTPDQADTPEKVGRRALMRRAAGLAAAGIGGVAATEMLSAGPAAAGAGDPMVLNASNDADSVQVKLTSDTAAGATFHVSNGGNVANLRLPPVAAASVYADPDVPTGDPGHVMAGGELINLTESVGTENIDTLFWMAGDNADGKLHNMAVVLTTATGTVFVPYGPLRALDTRSSRTLVANPTALDSSHRLIGGRTLELQLDGFVQFAYAVHFNVTAVSPTAGGYLTVFGSQNAGGGALRPLASNINFTKGVTIANHGVSPLTDRLSLFIFASQTTHVIIDIQGWTLPDFSFLNSNGAGKVAGAQFRSQAAKNGLGFVRRPVQRNQKND